MPEGNSRDDTGGSLIAVRTPPRVLIVDDNPMNLDILRACLAAVEELVRAEPAGDFALRGFASPVPAFNVLGLR
jgi:class 3 adenylate cyclase